MNEREALKLALEAMESVTVECNNFHHPKKDQNHHWAKCPPVVRWDRAITAIKEALAQPKQEPVVWMYQDKISHAVKFQKHMSDFVDHSRWYETPLYATPPQRSESSGKPAAWVGLTDEEELKLAQDSMGKSRHWLVAQVEAKLKELNT